MFIAIIADDNKKELMAQFCTAYNGILGKHNICATHITGQYISDASGLKIETLLAGSSGGTEQIASRVSYNEIDLVFYFRSTDPFDREYEGEKNLLRLCDEHNIPFATNLSTAEALVLALDNGMLDWRNLANPRSEYNQKKKRQI